MRKSVLTMLGLAALAGVIVAIAVDRTPEAPRPAAQPESLLTPPEVAKAPDQAAAPGQPAADTSPPSAAAPAPPKPAAPDLPTIEVAQRPVHMVPDEDTPAPKVTLFDRKGKELPSSKQAALTPPSPPPTSAPSSSAPFPPLTVFGGPAQAAGGTALAVAGKSVQLFGVRIADPRDRCGLGFGDNRSCADVARDTLAQRLKRYPMVSCHVPPGQRGNPGAICVDNSGTDLGGFLVAEGLALADTTQSYEYFGSEGVARSFRRGLWHNR